MQTGVLVLCTSLCLAVPGEAETSHGDSTFIVTPIGEEGYATLAQFLDYDQGLPLAPRTVEKEDLAFCTREKVVFSGPDGERVPGYLALPKSGAGPFPVILQLHGLSGSKNQWWEDNGYSSMGLVTKGLLNQGFAVLALDAEYHGERLLENDYESPWNLITSGRFVRYRGMVLKTVVEYRLAMDYLATRADIDTSRIGATGYSMGGVMTFMLTAKDARIKAAVACVSPVFGLTIIKGFVDTNMTVETFQKVANTLPPRVGINVQNFAHAVGSRPFLMIMASKDDFYSPREAQQLYRLIPGPTKELLFFDSGHSLPPEHTPKVAEWFEKHLK